MTLGYSQFFPDGTPTHFREKILKGIMSSTGPLSVELKGHELQSFMDIEKDIKPKLHTLRHDPTNRWHAGNDIHHVYGNRTKNRTCFLQNKCISTQQVQIKHNQPESFLRAVPIEIPPSQQKQVSIIIVDGRVLAEHEMERIAVNDGFRDLAHFFEWFKDDFSPKLIHWTNLKY